MKDKNDLRIENALARRSRFSNFLAPILEPSGRSFFWWFFEQLFDHFLPNFWNHFGTHVWDQIHPKGTKISPRGPLGASKNQKTALTKTGFRVGLSAFFHSWGLPREPQEAQEGSQEAPKELQNPQKMDPKMNPKITKFLTNFGAILGSILGSKIAPKGDQKWEPFLGPKPR